MVFEPDDFKEGKTPNWEGNFSQYLSLTAATFFAGSAHGRIYDMIMKAGVSKEGGQKKYRFFAGDIYGLEKTIEMLVEDYLRPASMHLDIKKRIFAGWPREEGNHYCQFNQKGAGGLHSY